MNIPMNHPDYVYKTHTQERSAEYDLIVELCREKEVHKELIHDLIGLVESMRIYCYEYKAEQIKKIIERAWEACK